MVSHTGIMKGVCIRIALENVSDNFMWGQIDLYIYEQNSTSSP